MFQQFHSPRMSGSAGDTQTFYGVWAHRNKGRITKAFIGPDTTSAKDGTDYLTISVKNGSTTLFSHATSATALTAGTAQEMTEASSLGKSAEFSQGDEITFDVAKAASGKAFGFTITLEVEIIR